MIVYQYFTYQMQITTLRNSMFTGLPENMMNQDNLLSAGTSYIPNPSYPNKPEVVTVSAPTQPISAPVTILPVPAVQSIVAPGNRDLIRDLDYKTLTDPLTEPTRRQPRYIYGPLINNPYFNYPTRGYQDSFSMIGYLVDEHAPKNDDNHIIKLFGRQKYPGSSEYEYYVENRVGGERLKLPLENQRRELYDDDEVYVELIKRNYKVKTLPDKTLQYSPYLF
jgi:hypothetical protein